MKKLRADGAPKFRRSMVKGTKGGRMGANTSEYYFISSSNFIYLKFLGIWLTCVALDFLIGFRFELLWPVWLLIRHLYESFRLHAFPTTLHYSAFSVFFVCVTATSDLICYLFIPIQVLIFLASTYVWVQFVYQSTEKGICFPSLFLWALFIAFEYSVRFRFDASTTWYIMRSSWLTTGLFPSTADTLSLGASSNISSSPRLELYRPFAAHCIGFPVVTLGFRAQSFFSKWRVRVRREEVRRQNEFFERLLSDATPCLFEDRKISISTIRNPQFLEQDAIEYEHNPSSVSNGGIEDLNTCYSNVTTSGFQNISTNFVRYAVCSSLSAQNGTSSTSSTFRKNLPHKSTKQNLSSTFFNKQHNGQLSYQRRIPSNIAANCHKDDWNNVSNVQNVGQGKRLWRFFYDGVSMLNSYALVQLQQDDLISSSGDGSNLADELEESEKEDNNFLGTNGNLIAQIPISKKKLKKARFKPHQNMAGSSTASNNFVAIVTNGSILSVTEHSAAESGKPSEYYNSSDINEQVARDRAVELKQLCNEKQMLEQTLEKIKMDLRLSKNNEVEIRAQLTLSQQQERNYRDQLKQVERDSKAKIEQLETKCRQLGKQNDSLKTNISALEKRVGELQSKKHEIERELTNERINLAKQCSREDVLAKLSHSKESNDQLKVRLNSMDRELKNLKRDIKSKEEACLRSNEELKRFEEKRDEDLKQVDILRQKNFDLEQTLSSENRLKQELFRALNDSKAQIASLNFRLHAIESKNDDNVRYLLQQHGDSPVLHPSSFSQNSVTPLISMGAHQTLNMDQLLQATGAQQISYSLGPLNASENDKQLSPLGGLGSFDPNPNELLTIGSHRINGNAFSSLIQNSKKNI